MPNRENKTSEKMKKIRREYHDIELSQDSVDSDPLNQFDAWFSQALESEELDPNAMTLATVSDEGKPRARIVLLKDYSSEGFVFYTGYDSRKGKDLEKNSNASLVFFWPSLSRQVLIEGKVSRVSRQQTEEYFRNRPRSSQLAAAVSDQSQIVQTREELISRMDALDQKYKNHNIPCPENWGGYCLKPDRFEFWQGRPNRLNDRISYFKTNQTQWRIDRLSP